MHRTQHFYAFDTCLPGAIRCAGGGNAMLKANDVRPNDVLRHGAYVCFTVPPAARQSMAEAAVPALATRLGFGSEFEAVGGHPADAIAFLRRVGATPADIADDELLRADAVVHVASPKAE